MEVADKISDQFAQNGDYEYIARLQSVRNTLNKIVDEIIAAQGTDDALLDTLNQMRQDLVYADALVRSDFAASIANVLRYSGLTEDLDCGAFKLENVADAVSATDAVNLQVAQALLAAGAQPQNVAITSLNKGTATAGQTIGVDESGNIIGFDGTVVGDIKIFPISESPADWLPFDDSIYVKSTHQALADKYPEWAVKFSDVDETVTPDTSANSNCLWVDDAYIYVGMSGGTPGNGRNIKILDKTTRAVITGVPDILGNVLSVCSDTNRVYIAHSGSPYLTVLEKSDWSVVAGTPVPGNYANSICVDDNYLYFGTTSNTARIYQLSDWSNVHSFSTSGTVTSVFADASRVYFAVNQSPWLKILDIGTWATTSGAPSKSQACYFAIADDTYMYIGLASSPGLEAYDLATWTLQTGTPDLTNVYKAAIDSSNLFIDAPNEPGRYRVYNKSDYSDVLVDLSFASAMVGLQEDANYLYLLHTTAGDPVLTIVDKALSTEFKLPQADSPIPNTKYLVRA